MEWINCNCGRMQLRPSKRLATARDIAALDYPVNWIKSMQEKLSFFDKLAYK